MRPQAGVNRLLSSPQRVGVGAIGGEAGRHLGTRGAQMEKPARGEIRVQERDDGTLTFSIRFRVNGKRQIMTLGTNKDGWTWRKAERKLDHALAQVRADVWQPEGADAPRKGRRPHVP
jgi:hypothetical protein